MDTPPIQKNVGSIVVVYTSRVEHSRYDLARFDGMVRAIGCE